MRRICFESGGVERFRRARALGGVLGAILAVAAAWATFGQVPSSGREGTGTIRKMGRLSANEGWVLTDAALLLTRDAGMGWTDIARGDWVGGVIDVQFLSASDARLAGVNDESSDTLVVFDTVDGGWSWRKRIVEESALASGRSYVGARIGFLDSADGWILGQVGTSSAFSVGELLRTGNGGASWERLPRPPVAGRFVFVDSRRGFMTGAPVSERLYRTLDGGWSWEEFELPVPVEPGMALYDLPTFHSPMLGMLAVTVRGDAPRVLTFVTCDGGSSWLPAGSWALPTGDYDEPAPVALDEDGELLAVAGRGTIGFFAKGAGLKAVPPKPIGGWRALGEGAAISVRQIARSNDGRIWALVAEGSCGGGVCRQETRLVAVDASGPDVGPVEELLVRVREEAQPRKRATTVSKAGVVSLDMGFDKCEAATTAQMQTWWDHGPFAVANIYFGGAARACSQINLEASWVSTVFTQGWRLIPTWVGPQPPCTNFIRRFSSDPTEARSDGLVEADAAVAAAAALGLGAGTPLYYDVEYYDEIDASCSAAVREFVDAWTEQINDHGYLAGAYGNARNVQNDWIPGILPNPPDAVWLTPWVCGRTSSCDWTPTVFDVPGLGDSYWASYRRIRQYWGPHTETWGGVTFEIDRDYANGPVAAESSSASCWHIVPPGRWQGEYFGNTGLSGSAAMVRDDGDGFLAFDWGMGSPGVTCDVPADGFSVRWIRTAHFDAGTYRFTATGDDGVRLAIDGVLVIDEWRDQPPATYVVTAVLSGGDHTVRLDSYESTGAAAAGLSWRRLSRTRRAGGRRIPS